MTISRSSALSINVLLIFDVHDLNSASFLNAIPFRNIVAFSATKRSVVPSTTI